MADIEVIVTPPAQVVVEVTPGYPEAATATAASNASATSAAAAAVSEANAAASAATATTEAGIATGKASDSATSAAAAAASEANAAASAATATTEAGIATGKASDSATSAAAAAASEANAAASAATATTEAGIATGKASDSATSAAAAAVSEANAAASATAASGSATAAAASAASIANQQLHGQCRLDFVSSTQVKLSPFNGNRIIIDNVAQQIPATAPTLSNSGIGNLTARYVYVGMVSGVMTLSSSTTGYATDPRNGVLVLSGDATKTFVGMVGTDSSGLFQDSVTARLVKSFFNQKRMGLYAYFTYSTSSTSWVELSSSSRVYFLGDGKSGDSLAAATIEYIQTANDVFCYFAMGINGATNGGPTTCKQYTAREITQPVNQVQASSTGINYFSAFGYVASGSYSGWGTVWGSTMV
ncbi:MAG: hypothetical protein PW734_06960 [Verrucomicrobium sp.]|nr:hypothetical protein [Verrucomicrobium sp.]